MSQPTTLHRPNAPVRIGGLGLVGLFSLTTAVLALGGPPAQAEVASGSGCAETDGVTVVVDFTDVGGQIQVGCAEGDPASGREALEAAGFTPEDSQPGMICAVDGLPDPCPEEFEGSFWSYWYAEDGAWASYQVGADEADPGPGDVQGWRYFDGSAGPQVEPAAAIAAAPAEDSEDTEAGEDASDDSSQDKDDAGHVDEESEDFDPSGLIAAGVLALVLIAGIVLVLRRRSAMRED